jgi:hypothetical protein
MGRSSLDGKMFDIVILLAEEQGPGPTHIRIAVVGQL